MPFHSERARRALCDAALVTQADRCADKDRLKKELISKAKALEKGAEFYELNV